jgi:hypothetical protein
MEPTLLLVIVAVCMLVECVLFALPTRPALRLPVQRVPDVGKTLHVTHVNKTSVPPKVWAMWQTFAPEYTVMFYDDAAARQMVQQYDQHQRAMGRVLAAYDRLVGAHRADLFRYCVLYERGGVYTDVKTRLLCALDEWIDPKRITSILSYHAKTVHQGVIAAPPHEPMFLHLIKEICAYVENASKIQRGPTVAVIPHLLFTSQFYEAVLHDLGETHARVPIGESTGHDASYCFLQEHCTPLQGERTSSEHAAFLETCICDDGRDRYGRCCVAKNKTGKAILQIRWADFPWKTQT